MALAKVANRFMLRPAKKLRQADHVHAHMHVNVNVDVVVHVLVTGCLRLIENLSLTTMIAQRSAQTECRSRTYKPSAPQTTAGRA